MITKQDKTNIWHSILFSGEKRFGKYIKHKLHEDSYNMILTNTYPHDEDSDNSSFALRKGN